MKFFSSPLQTRGTATIDRPIEDHLLFPQESTVLRFKQPR